MSQTENTSPESTNPESTGIILRLRKVYSERPNIDFPRIWPKVFLVSVVILLIAGMSWGVRGLNLGIEFEGGVVWELKSDNTSVSELRDALEPFGQGDARIQSLSGNIYRVRAELDIENTASAIEIRNALAEKAEIPPTDVSYSAVGPSWGDEITDSARTALIVFFCVVAVYIWLRLEWRMTLAAMVAVGHDILVTVGAYALFQFEVTPATLIAFLTILGYSLYDTLVVFDKIRENENRRERMAYSDLVSKSMNQVILRSINTTITSVLPVASLLIIGRFLLGAVTLGEFAIALLIGILAGTYSSVFVATPLVAWLKNPTRQKAEDSRVEPVAAASRPKKGMLAQSRVTTAPSTTPRPRKKKRKS